MIESIKVFFDDGEKISWRVADKVKLDGDLLNLDELEFIPMSRLIMIIKGKDNEIYKR